MIFLLLILGLISPQTSPNLQTCKAHHGTSGARFLEAYRKLSEVKAGMTMSDTNTDMDTEEGKAQLASSSVFSNSYTVTFAT